MPELPEVETIKRELLQKIKGKKIVSVEVLSPKTINCSADKFKKTIENSKIKDVQRRAKLLIIKLSNNYNLAENKGNIIPVFRLFEYLRPYQII